MSLMKEFESEERGPGRRSKKTDILKKTMDQKEYKELIAALKADTFSTSAIARVLAKRGHKVNRWNIADMRERVRNGEEV